MLRYLALLLLIPINTLSAFTDHDFFRGLDFSEIQQSLLVDECYLLANLHKSYFISNNIIDSFEICAETVKTSMLNLEKEVASYQGNPFAHNPSTYNRLCRELHAALIAPIAHNLTPRILIVSAPELRSIPWNALSPQNGTFLIDKHEVTLSYKGWHKYESLLSSTDHSIHYILPEFTGNLAIKTSNERQQLERILPFGTKELNQSSIIHIGSHGSWDGDYWERSGIVIGKNQILDNAEVSSLCLNSRLVFLNICEGARTGQNGLSIVDAFQTAGADAIIGALWEIDDHMAVHVSRCFYKNVLEGQRISQALRESILHFRDQKEETGSLNPIHWSAYQVYGQNLRLLDQQGFTFKKIASVTLSVGTSFSLLFYYFGSRIKSIILDYNLI